MTHTHIPSESIYTIPSIKTSHPLHFRDNTKISDLYTSCKEPKPIVPEWRLQQDLGFVLDAAIVRILKRYKIISIDDLMYMLAQQYHNIDLSFIKTRLLLLEKKEYLTCSEMNNQHIINYIP